MPETTDVIDTTVARWHQFLRGELDGGLDALLHQDCVFLSPIVFTPQKGRDLTAMYLNAAAATFSAGAPAASSPREGSQPVAGRSFRYVKQVASGHHAFLEFETQMGDTYVNGVDILTCDADSLITEFKVMIRPMKAINLMRGKMAELLESMQS